MIFIYTCLPSLSLSLSLVSNDLGEDFEFIYTYIILCKNREPQEWPEPGQLL